jgi:hypothetical protein
VEAHIAELIRLAADVNSSKDLKGFDTYRKKLISWARASILSEQRIEVKKLLVRVLELKLDRPWWYRLIFLSKYKADLVENWEEEGKYRLYLQESTTLLDAIRFNLLSP